MVSEIINQLLDDTNRIKQTELRSRAIDEAAMSRALQIYFSHSELQPPEDLSLAPTPTEGGQAEEKIISQVESQFLDDIGSLKEFSLSSVIRIHRELCGKRIITKHVAGGKRKVSILRYPFPPVAHPPPPHTHTQSTGSNRVRGYDIREKVFQNLNAGSIIASSPLTSPSRYRWELPASPRRVSREDSIVERPHTSLRRSSPGYFQRRLFVSPPSDCGE
jgi:hypothetical protein